jgi:aspartate carbamoyltransferase catalytic subunit
MTLSRTHLLGLGDLSPEIMTAVLDSAGSFAEISERSVKKVPTLRGKTVVNLFLEPSTRTRVSFELAAKRLSADTLSISGSASSVVKGESLLDTARTLAAYAPDIIVLRHKAAGAAHLLTQHIDASLVNAGDGAREHPTQGLLDLYTARKHFGALKGLNVTIIGDVAHSRVARSGIIGFAKMGSQVTVCGPPTMVPQGVEALGCSVTYNREEAVRNADVIMLLRIQKERLSEELFPSDREYRRLYGVDRDVLSKVPSHAMIMHPGPVNRGVELCPDVADGPRSLILDQVRNGLAVRMAVLFYCASGGGS